MTIIISRRDDDDYVVELIFSYALQVDSNYILNHIPNYILPITIACRAYCIYILLKYQYRYIIADLAYIIKRNILQ